MKNLVLHWTWFENQWKYAGLSKDIFTWNRKVTPILHRLQMLNDMHFQIHWELTLLRKHVHLKKGAWRRKSCYFTSFLVVSSWNWAWQATGIYHLANCGKWCIRPVWLCQVPPSSITVPSVSWQSWAHEMRNNLCKATEAASLAEFTELASMSIYRQTEGSHASSSILSTQQIPFRHCHHFMDYFYLKLIEVHWHFYTILECIIIFHNV